MGLLALERQVKRDYHGLEPADHAIITRDQRDFLERLGSFKAPYLEEKLMSEGKFDSHEQYHEAFNEFKKYVALYAITNQPLKMSSKAVDSIWHQFILFTPHYREFCNEMLGNYMDHIPTTSFNPSVEGSGEMFSQAYQKIFGEVPRIWDSKKGVFDKGASEECVAGGGCMCGCNP